MRLGGCTMYWLHSYEIYEWWQLDEYEEEFPTDWHSLHSQFLLFTPISCMCEQDLVWISWPVSDFFKVQWWCGPTRQADMRQWSRLSWHYGMLLWQDPKVRILIPYTNVIVFGVVMVLYVWTFLFLQFLF